MSIIKSYSVGNGDMFYIKHNSDNFTIIDCCLSDDNKEDIVNELKNESSGDKIITRFISTHPDEDHIHQLNYLDDQMSIFNFYCVKNSVSKEEDKLWFKKYYELRDSGKAYYLNKDCRRCWLNRKDETRGSSGVEILWPDINNSDFMEALKTADESGEPNNISPIIQYSMNSGVTALWMGDIESDFMEKIKDEVSFEKSHILFAPHHGRKSGKVIKEWLNQINPDLIVIGEAASKDIDYYKGYNTITQNSSKDIVFDCVSGKVHVYVSNEGYDATFLSDEGLEDLTNHHYIGTLNLNDDDE